MSSMTEDLIKSLLVAVLVFVGVSIPAYHIAKSSCQQAAEVRSGTEYHDYKLLTGCWVRVTSRVVNQSELRTEGE